ncbi:hypothetical protein B7R54_04380 [Subtercola boreus]|uniref:Uncharacterized protein n=1 Tax=Subtercola boreus TaxID=120213 RepID=A0A3E0VI60_9MICO|nr:hypothetical protein [Subtercola boreus]RFA08547.1 hypothetical protein B7R54_04380 [Subtercola boreus]TQL54524.1 hypothetical protein FB464_2063 [Subtercola boreus]
MPPPSTARTTLLGGFGIVIAMLVPLVGSLDPTWPRIPGSQLLSWMIFAVALGILAFGVPGESGIVGDSVVGRVALFVFGIHQLVLGIASTVTPVPTDPVSAKAQAGSTASIVGGWVFEAILVAGLVAAAVAAVVIVRAGLLGGPARWALLPVPLVDAIGLVLLFVPVQEVALVGAQLSEAVFVLLALVGAAYALDGRWPAIRRWLRLVNEKW